MKVSLKVREEQRPLIRAKLPLNVLGLPLFTGVTSGDQRDLALHLGTDVQAGPSVRVAYKPNNVFSPFSVLVKTGFGLWGSPSGAALAMSAEFNLNSGASPSFFVRLKPKVGDFGFRKDSGCFKASYDTVDRSTSGDEKAMSSGEKTKFIDANAVASGREANVHPIGKSPAVPGGHGAASANGDLHGKSSAGLGKGSGAFVMEKVESFSNGTLERSDSLERSREITEYGKSMNGSLGEGAYDEHVADSEDDAVAGQESSSVRRRSWFGGSGEGWRFNAHSSIPLGRWAVGRVRWQVKFGSNLFHDVKHGLHISDIKLPSLTVDKVSFEVHKNPRSSSDLAGLGFGYGGDESSQLGRIASMCASMRYQLQLLHLENKLLKSTIDDWRGDGGVRRPAVKGTELMMQEETALRSQMFDELNGKLNGGNSSKTRDGKYNKDGLSMGDSQSAPWGSSGKGATSTGEDFTINVDQSEGLQKAIMNATGGSYGP